MTSARVNEPTQAKSRNMTPVNSVSTAFVVRLTTHNMTKKGTKRYAIIGTGTQNFYQYTTQRESWNAVKKITIYQRTFQKII